MDRGSRDEVRRRALHLLCKKGISICATTNVTDTSACLGIEHQANPPPFEMAGTLEDPILIDDDKPARPTTKAATRTSISKHATPVASSKQQPHVTLNSVLSQAKTSPLAYIAAFKTKIDDIERRGCEASTAMRDRLHAAVIEYQRADQSFVDDVSQLLAVFPEAGTLNWAQHCLGIPDRELFAGDGIVVKFHLSFDPAGRSRPLPTSCKRCAMDLLRFPDAAMMRVTMWGLLHHFHRNHHRQDNSAIPALSHTLVLLFFMRRVCHR
ncbi:hypothetical protein B0T14DRAFT_127125 [Immersiella caudata]|uniref:Uncharacterized protein n=1 Tax=Immersiella caudata TaxID=314043 RepID=A0AA39X4D5_9PEZI|nr:hypothetical protein B0T14DRAFT_127125 [Immersiella caudata]